MPIAPLASGTCQVWWARPSHASVLDSKLLSAEERRICARWRRAIDRDRFTTGALMTRLMLGHYLGVSPTGLDIDRTCSGCGRAHGRPRILGSSLQVSVSHAKDRVLVACGDFEGVGVDVEPVVETAEAQALLPSIINDEELSAAGWAIPYWVRKEAVLKATGKGLSVPMRNLTVSPPYEPPSLLHFEGHDCVVERVSMTQLQYDVDYYAVLAVIGTPLTQVIEQDISEAMC